MRVNKALPLIKMAYFKPKRYLFTSLSIPQNRKNSWKKTICLQTHFREICLSAIHHHSSVLILQHSSATVTHRSNKAINRQPVKIQEFCTFLQINIVRSSDTDKMHFTHCWLKLCQVQAIISSILEQTFYRLIYCPTPLYLFFSCETMDCNLNMLLLMIKTGTRHNISLDGDSATTRKFGKNDTNRSRNGKVVVEAHRNLHDHHLTGIVLTCSKFT